MEKELAIPPNVDESENKHYDGNLSSVRIMADIDCKNDGEDRNQIYHDEFLHDLAKVCWKVISPYHNADEPNKIPNVNQDQSDRKGFSMLD
jgi:hypothetical protein